MAGPNALDIPASDDFQLTPWHVCPDRENRIDLSAWAASQHQRIFGFIASITECSTATENTDTAYKFEVITRIPFLPDGFTDRSPHLMSWLFVKVLAYSSNALISDKTEIGLGTFVSGIVTANYNGRGRATLDAWQVVTDLSGWRAVAPETFPDKPSYDWTEWVVEWTCTLGGSAFAVHEPDENRIQGVRINPPVADVHLFLRARREALKTDDPAKKPRTVTINDSDATYVRPRGRSSSRRPAPRSG